MKIGKINWDDLKEVIDNSKGVKRKEVRISSGIGEDCSIISFGEYECVLSTDPITGAASNTGSLAVNINCNDIASCGAEPLGILVTILAPEGTSLKEIKKVMKDIDEETKKLNVEVIGGHTEITDAVNRLVVSCTAVGRAKAGKGVSTAGAKAGDDIIITKELCLEGTCILANDYEKKLEGVLTTVEIEKAKGFLNNISVVEEGKIAGDYGVSSMHDITEGGVLGALWEMAEASGIGFKVFQEKMPVNEITEKICRFFQIDPLRLISSGSMLIAVKNGEDLVNKLKEKGIKAAIIGKITDHKGVLVSQGEEKEVLPPERDELFKCGMGTFPLPHQENK